MEVSIMLFYDLIYSPDDGGWYYDLMDEAGISLPGDYVIYNNQHVANDNAILAAKTLGQKATLLDIYGFNNLDVLT